MKVVKLIQEKIIQPPIQLDAEYAIDIEKLTILKKQLIDGFATAKSIFDENQLPGTIKLGATQSPESAQEWIMDLSQHTNDLASWANFNAVILECKQNGLGEFVQETIETGVLPKSGKTFFFAGFICFWMSIYKKSPYLQKFRGTLQTEMVQKFKDLDTALIEGAPYVIKQRLYADKPNGE